MACVFCGDAGAMDFLLNVILFVPLGVGLALVGLGRGPGGAGGTGPAPASVLVAFGVSLTIEVLQATVIAGRHAALGDLMANTLGGVIGLWLPRWSLALLIPPPGRAAWLGAAVLAMGLSWPAAAVWLLRPSPAPTPVWYGQWAHELGGMAPFGGRVLGVRLDTVPIPRGRLADQEAVRRVWAAPVRFEAEVVTGPVPPLQAQVAAIADGTGGWTAAIWQDGPDAIMSLRLRTGDALLRTPIARVRGAFEVPEGTPLLLGIEVHPDRVTAGARAPGHQATTSYALGPTLAWVLLWPYDVAFTGPPRVRSGLWAFGWFLLISGPATFWLARAGRARTGIALSLLLVPLSLGVIPAATSSGMGTLLEWGLAVGGTLVGVVAGRGWRRRD